VEGPLGRGDHARRAPRADGSERVPAAHDLGCDRLPRRRRRRRLPGGHVGWRRSRRSPPETVEIFSWWTSGGEEDALDAVIRRFEEEHPGLTVINAAEEYAEKARETLRARVALGSPPDTFQANIGADLLRWVGDTDVETALEPLDELADFPDAFDSMHRATAAAFRRDRLAMALSGLLPSGTLQNLSSELKAATQAGSIEIIQNYLVANYVALE